MQEPQEERIRFSIKGPEGVYRGEALGRDLRQHSTFEVRLSNGETFRVEARPHPGPRAFQWVADATESFCRLAPVVGAIIENYFKRKKQSN